MIRHCQLYRFGPNLPGTRKWNERGRGDILFYKHNKTDKYRMVLREKQTNKLRMNHFVPIKSKIYERIHRKACQWVAVDLTSDNPFEIPEKIAYTFCVSFECDHGMCTS